MKMTHDELWLKYRHDANRKTYDWEDICGPAELIDEQDARAMPIFRAEDIGTEGSPLDGGIPKGTLICLIVHRGRPYLVNTEGFTYARYIIPARIVKSLKEVDIQDLLG